MAKRRKTNINRKKHSSDGSSDFLSEMPSVSELTNEQEKIEQSNTFSDSHFDGTSTSIRTEPLVNESEKIVPLNIENNSSNGEENNSHTIGAYLKTERNKKGVSLKSISQNTKISHTNLEYLENDELSKLPNKTYVFGYIKSYAKTLGLDEEHCLELARNHYDEGKNPVILESHMSPISEAKKPLNIKYMAFLAAFILLTITIFLFTRTSETPKVVQKPVENRPKIKVVTSQTPLKNEVNTSTEVNEPTQVAFETATPPAPTQPEVKVTETTPEPKPEVKKPEPKPEPKPEVKEVKKEPVSEVKKEEKKENEELELTPLSNQLYSFNTSLSVADVDKMIPDRFQQATIKGFQNVFIKASKGNTWLTYKSDDKPIKKFVLKEGRNLLIRGKEIRLFLGNINAIDIFLNNQPLSLTSSSGVKSLVFPQENGSKYMLPLFIYKKDGTVETSDNYQ